MNAMDFLVLIVIALCLAIAGVFWGYQKEKQEECNGSCAACHLTCGNSTKKDKEKEKKDDK